MVRTRRCAGLVQIQVIDSGVGMAAAELSRVFDAFAQGDHARAGGSHKFGGLGLGLAISRSLIGLHAGSIRAESGGIGQGSTFTIELPLSLVPAAVTSAASVPPAGETPLVSDSLRLRILLVEDHDPTRAVLAHLLARRNHHVVTASNVKEALALGHANEFDVLVTDIGLPDGSGYDLMEAFDKGGLVRGIALTGFGMEDDFERSQKAGFDAHLTKPVQIGTLESALERMKGLVESNRLVR